jgi:ribosomal-protein-alanine N-acetyltransferase
MSGVAGLLAHVLAACPDRRVQLEVRASNQPARALYARAGFVVDGRRPRYYPDGEDAVLMSWRAA